MKNLLTVIALIIVIAGLTVSAALLILPLAVLVVGVAVISRLFDDVSQPALVGQPAAVAERRGMVVASQLSARAA